MAFNQKLLEVIWPQNCYNNFLFKGAIHYSILLRFLTNARPQFHDKINQDFESCGFCCQG